ncbi:MAG: hypothetical protein ACLGGX_11240 [Bdellovibrionia bacterium]
MKRILKRWVTVVIYCLLSTIASIAVAESVPVSNVLTSNSLASRKTQARNYLTFDLGGRGGIYSLNIERRFSKQATLGIGFSHYSLELNPTIAKTDVSLSILPLYANFYFNNSQVNYFISSGASIVFLEANADVNLNDALGELKINLMSSNNENLSVSTNSEISSQNSTRIVMPLPNLGFGVEYRSGGALLRLAAHSFYTDRFYHWAGFSIGAGF